LDHVVDFLNTTGNELYLAISR